MKKITYSLILLFLLVSLKEVYAIDPPTLQTPSNGATNVPIPVNFNWSDVTGAAYYSLTVYYGFEIAFYKDSISTSNYNNVDLQGNSTYYWKAASKTAGGADSAESYPLWSFTTGNALPVAPTLIFPPDDTTNMPTNITFDWEDNAGSILYYTLQYTIDPNFVNGIVSINASSSQLYVTGLLSSTVYFWRVRATNSTGAGPYSPIWNFETLPVVPPAPNLLSPPNNTGNVTLTPLLDWTDVQVGSVVYDVQVAADPGYANLIHEAYNLPASQNQVPPNVLSGGVQYWWHARAKNIAGPGPWSTTFSFSTQNAPPAPPVLVYPADSSENIPLSNFNFAWNASYGANSYRIQVANNPGFSPNIINSTTSGTTFQMPSGQLQNYTRYYWRVQASSVGGGTGNFSAINTFRTIPGLLPPPALNSPSCGATNVTLTPLMKWFSVPNAVAYRLQISVTSNYGTLVFNQIVYDTAYQVIPGLLTGGYTYYWRVASVNAAMNEGSFGYPPNFCSFQTKQTLNTNLKVLLEGFYNGTTQVRDTIRVYLAQTGSPWTLKDSTLAYLNSNGTDTASFENSVAGTYYLVVKHRNHIETWSALPIALSLGVYVNYDFTTGANKAFGNNMKQVGSVWVLYGGDADQSGQVFVNDYNLFITQFGWDGYISCDLNGNTFVDGYDLPILYGNINVRKHTPANP